MTTHLAITVNGRPFHAAGFDYSSHDRHVAAGHCPVVQSSKVWCVLKAGHHVNRHQAWRSHASDFTMGTRKFWDWP
jgi:hypothetical protein